MKTQRKSRMTLHISLLRLIRLYHGNVHTQHCHKLTRHPLHKTPFVIVQKISNICVPMWKQNLSHWAQLSLLSLCPCQIVIGGHFFKLKYNRSSPWFCTLSSKSWQVFINLHYLPWMCLYSLILYPVIVHIAPSHRTMHYVHGVTSHLGVATMELIWWSN